MCALCFISLPIPNPFGNCSPEVLTLMCRWWRASDQVLLCIGPGRTVSLDHPYSTPPLPSWPPLTEYCQPCTMANSTGLCKTASTPSARPFQVAAGSSVSAWQMSGFSEMGGDSKLGRLRSLHTLLSRLMFSLWVIIKLMLILTRAA